MRNIANTINRLNESAPPAADDLDEVEHAFAFCRTSVQIQETCSRGRIFRRASSLDRHLWLSYMAAHKRQPTMRTAQDGRISPINSDLPCSFPNSNGKIIPTFASIGLPLKTRLAAKERSIQSAR